MTMCGKCFGVRSESSPCTVCTGLMKESDKMKKCGNTNCGNLYSPVNDVCPDCGFNNLFIKPVDMVKRGSELPTPLALSVDMVKCGCGAIYHVDSECPDCEITNPKHYQLFADGKESFDVISSFLNCDEFIGFCKGNILKYRLRAGKKGDAEKCIAKADWYENKLKEFLS